MVLNQCGRHQSLANLTPTVKLLPPHGAEAGKLSFPASSVAKGSQWHSSRQWGRSRMQLRVSRKVLFSWVRDRFDTTPPYSFLSKTEHFATMQCHLWGQKGQYIKNGELKRVLNTKIPSLWWGPWAAKPTPTSRLLTRKGKSQFVKARQTFSYLESNSFLI